MERAQSDGPGYERGNHCYQCASRSGTGRWKLHLPTEEERTALEEKRAMENQHYPHRDIVPDAEKTRAAGRSAAGRVRLEAGAEEVCYSLGHSDGAEGDFS